MQHVEEEREVVCIRCNVEMHQIQSPADVQVYECPRCEGRMAFADDESALDAYEVGLRGYNRSGQTFRLTL